MSELLTEYEKRLRKRDINADHASLPKKKIGAENLKFKPNGDINPHFGLTCIVWIGPETKLHKKLSAYQRVIKTALDQAGLSKFFSFLDPQSFHMTICDIVASPIPIQSQKAAQVVDQIDSAFSSAAKNGAVTCQIQGIGFASTLSALARFEKEAELRKAINIEQCIKDAAQVNVRNFTGHISLAYLVSDPGKVAHRIMEILRSYSNATFGSLTFSEFDLTSFTDMNTFIPLLSINFEHNQIMRYQNIATQPAFSVANPIRF